MPPLLKKIFPGLLIFVLVILFHTLFENLASKLIVNPILSHIESNWVNDVVFILITLIPVTYSIRRFRQYNPSLKFFGLLVSITIIYLYYRFNTNVWLFKSFAFSDFFKYGDILIVCTISNLLLFIKNKEVHINLGSSTFFDDAPARIDKLGYSKYAESIANKINSSQFDQSFAIGINGKWGSGKTSFINFIQEKIDKENTIEVEFNPWNSHSQEGIIEDFFLTLRERLSPFHHSIPNLLLSYSKKLSGSESISVNKYITAATSLIEPESIESSHAAINEAIRSTNKKILIYIDDIDRLTPFEINEVLRLIRNTANFHNTFFIAAYDRNYVLSALKEQNQFSEEFLEKIFQVEISLPHFNRSKLRHELLEKLKTIFPKEYHETLREELFNVHFNLTSNTIEEWITTMRDVTRISNALALNSDLLLGEIVFGDMLRLELLRMKYPSIYELLHAKTSDFLTTGQADGIKYTYHLKRNDERANSISVLQEYIETNSSELSVPKKQIPKIIKLLEYIFPYYYPYNQSLLSVVNPSKFRNYFSYGLSEGSLSEVAFSKARDSSQENFNNEIEKWVGEKLEFELQKRLTQITSFDNKEDFEKIIRAIFFFANLDSVEQERYSPIVGYDNRELFYHQLYNRNGEISKLYQRKEELELFITELFEQAKEPYLFESTLLKFVHNNTLNDDDQYFPLDKTQTQEIVVNYFKSYCEKHKRIDQSFRNLLWACEETVYSHNGSAYNGKKMFLQEMKTYLIEKLPEYFLNDFLKSIIDFDPFNKRAARLNSSFILELFDSWTNFDHFLENQDENTWSYLEEFRIYYSLASENPERFIEFEFNKIPIS